MRLNARPMACSLAAHITALEANLPVTVAYTLSKCPGSNSSAVAILSRIGGNAWEREEAPALGRTLS